MHFPSAEETENREDHHPRRRNRYKSDTISEADLTCISLYISICICEYMIDDTYTCVYIYIHDYTRILCILYDI